MVRYAPEKQRSQEIFNRPAVRQSKKKDQGERCSKKKKQKVRNMKELMQTEIANQEGVLEDNLQFMENIRSF